MEKKIAGECSGCHEVEGYFACCADCFRRMYYRMRELVESVERP